MELEPESQEVTSITNPMSPQTVEGILCVNSVSAMITTETFFDRKSNGHERLLVGVAKRVLYNYIVVFLYFTNYADIGSIQLTIKNLNADSLSMERIRLALEDLKDKLDDLTVSISQSTVPPAEESSSIYKEKAPVQPKSTVIPTSKQQ